LNESDSTGGPVLKAGKEKKNETRIKGSTKPGKSWAGFCSRASKWAFYSGLFLGAMVFLPDDFHDGFEVPKLFCVELAAVLIAFFWVLSSVLRKAVIVRLPLCLLPLFVIFSIAAASVGWSLNRGLALERLYHVSALAAFLIFAWGFYIGRDIKKALYFIIFAAAAIALWGLMLDFVEPLRKAVYPGYGYDEVKSRQAFGYYVELISNQGNPNFLLHILVLTTPAALGALLLKLTDTDRRGSSAGRWLLAAGLACAFLVQLLCFFRSQNRSGVLSLILAMLFFAGATLLFKRKGLISFLSRNLRRLVFLIAGLLVAASALTFFSDTGRSLALRVKEDAENRLENWQTRFSHLRDPENIDVYSRVIFLETGSRMIAEDPLWGKGIGQFVIYYPRYKTEKQWDLFKFYNPEILRWAEIPPQAHNEYLQLLIELGLFALGAFLVFWLLFAQAFWRCLKRISGELEFFLLLGAGAGLLGTLFNSLFTFPLQTVTSAIFFWSVTGLLLARCVARGNEKGCRELAFKFSLQKPLWRIALGSATVILLGGCFWSSVKTIRAQYIFFDALKTHAHDLGYSIQRNRKAADLLPHNFGIQYVQGWLYRLAHDTTGARVYFERAIHQDPFFPEPYIYLPEYYYLNGDYAKAEGLLRRYSEIYSPGLPPQSEYLWGLICLQDSTGDRIAEADRHLRKYGSTNGLLALADAYYIRGRPDSTVSILKGFARTLDPDRAPELFIQAAHLYGLASFVTGDSATAREQFGKVIQQGNQYGHGDQFGKIYESARNILKVLDAEKK